MEAKQNSRDVCSNDAGKSQWWDTHQKCHQQTKGEDNEATDTLSVCYQRHK